MLCFNVRDPNGGWVRIGVKEMIYHMSKMMYQVSFHVFPVKHHINNLIQQFSVGRHEVLPHRMLGSLNHCKLLSERLLGRYSGGVVMLIVWFSCFSCVITRQGASNKE